MVTINREYALELARTLYGAINDDNCIAYSTPNENIFGSPNINIGNDRQYLYVGDVVVSALSNSLKTTVNAVILYRNDSFNFVIKDEINALSTGDRSDYPSVVFTSLSVANDGDIGLFACCFTGYRIKIK